MSLPRILFVTDDRESYSSGNYYLAYQRAFMRQGDVMLAHPLEPWPSLSRFDLVVLGHASIENLARMRGKRFVPRRLQSWLWFRHANLRALRRLRRTPVVLFTKNDYKHFPLKNEFISFLKPHTVITHTKRALIDLVGPAHVRMMWLPFGVDTEQFSPPTKSECRRFALGFRANANSDYNAGQRTRFFQALTRLEGKREVSLTLSQNGEGFLLGQQYVDWMRSCSLLGNTVSAAGTVGPRFLEAMACGTIPLAPRNNYEGLLVADKHYVAVDEGAKGNYPELESAVANFLENAGYRQQLLEEARILTAENSVDQHVKRVLRDVGVA